MQFFDCDEEFWEKIEGGTVNCTVKVSFTLEDGTTVTAGFEDVRSLELSTYCAKDGGVRTAAVLLLYDPAGSFASCGITGGCQAEICFCAGGLEYSRGLLYVGVKGAEPKKYGNGEKYCEVELYDWGEWLSERSVLEDWEEEKILTGCAVCDSESPEKSLVHVLADIGGATVAGCDDVALAVGAVPLSYSVWEELAEIAWTYKAHLECIGKSIVFLESAYRDAMEAESEEVFALYEDCITHFHRFGEYEDYANDLLLKYRRYASDGSFETRRVSARNESEISKRGRVTKRVTSRYVSEDSFNGTTFEEVRCADFLDEFSTQGKKLYVTTFLPLVHVRAGADMDIRVSASESICRGSVEEATLRYLKGNAFETRLWLKVNAE